MPITDALAYLHGTNTTGTAICHSASEYSTYQYDKGAAFISDTEKGYTFPPEVVGAGGVEFGMHVVVNQVFDTLTDITFYVCSGASDSPTYTANPIASRTLTLAQLDVLGAHYFVPFSLVAMLRYTRAYFALNGSATTLGTVSAWLGPRTGGEQ